METRVELAERSVRFMKLLPAEDDKILVTLKGHLLIEELITEILNVSLSGNNPINISVSERSQYANKLELCWAFNEKKLNEEFWASLKHLNEIRNAMAHRIEPIGVDEKIQKFCASVLPKSEFNKADYQGRELSFSIAWVHIVLSQTLHTIKNS